MCALPSRIDNGVGAPPPNLFRRKTRLSSSPVRAELGDHPVQQVGQLLVGETSLRDPGNAYQKLPPPRKVEKAIDMACESWNLAGGLTAIRQMTPLALRHIVRPRICAGRDGNEHR